jgi:hypothetical protein
MIVKKERKKEKEKRTLKMDQFAMEDVRSRFSSSNC